MSEYLSKEEIKQWRSSLEKITLEEYAARLGKKLEEDKPTNDLIDIVLHGKPVVSTTEDWMQPRTERITTIAQRAFEREQELSPSPFSISKLKLILDKYDEEPVKKTEKKTSSKQIKTVKTTEKTEKKETIKTNKSKTTKSAKTAKTTKTTEKTTTAKTRTRKSQTKTVKTSAKAVKAKKAVLSSKTTGDSLRDDIRIVFKKALTDREQRVFDHFAENKNQIVYAKDLATLLELPRDYVYKYIKNLRAKIEGDKLQNADKGGFILHI